MNNYLNIAMVFLLYCLMISFVSLSTAEGSGKIYKPSNDKKKIYGTPKEYSRQQKIQNRNISLKKYTTCRLSKRITSRTTKLTACIYKGGNKTFELMYEKNCPKQFKCVYNPYGKEPNIDSVIDSLNQIKKGKK